MSTQTNCEKLTPKLTEQLRADGVTISSIDFKSSDEPGGYNVAKVVLSNNKTLLWKVRNGTFPKVDKDKERLIFKSTN